MKRRTKSKYQAFPITLAGCQNFQAFSPGPDQQPGLKGGWNCPPKNTFSPGWCYHPGLKGPGLYISNGSSVHLLLFDLQRRSRRLRRARPRRALPRRRRSLPPPGLVVEPRPAAVELVFAIRRPRAAQLGPVAGQHAHHPPLAC